MIARDEIESIIDGYDQLKLRIGMTASHSALDICDGAIEEGFPTVAYAQKGRERTYSTYFRTHRSPTGRVRRGWWTRRSHSTGSMRSWTLNSRTRCGNATLCTSRIDPSPPTATSNVSRRISGSPCSAVATCRMEDRMEDQDYYWLLERAGLPFPERIDGPDDIDGLSIVKLHHAEKKLERGFFTCASTEEFEATSEKLLRQGVIDQASLEGARIEEYVIGPVFNLNFFHSPIIGGDDGLELLGVDWRFESSLDGHVRLPAPQQMTMPDHQMVPEMTVVGHNTATIRESLLERAFELGQAFIDASKEHYDPGIIGPFCLQTCIDKDMNYSIYDVAPRIGGGTNVHVNVGHPYGNSLWRKPMSSGRRIAMELRMAAEQDRLIEVLT